MKDDSYYQALAFFNQRRLSYKQLGLLYTFDRKHAKQIKRETRQATVKYRLRQTVRISDVVKIINGTMKAVATTTTGIPLDRMLK